MMPLSVTLAIAALVVSVPTLTWAVLAGPDGARRRAVTNLQLGLGSAHMRVPATAPDRVGSLTTLARRLARQRAVLRLDRLLSRAGRPPAWPMDRLLAAKVVLPPVVAALGFAYAAGTPGTLSVGITLVGTLVAYFLPELLLYSHAQKRSKQIGLELPDTLDQMTISVEAGLGFDSAMLRSGKNGRGPLAEELVRTLQDIQVGQTRRQAYEALAKRTEVADLRRFVRAIIQADIYGIAVADVLRTQASEMRLKRRQRAEEKAMQIPVKVIFPLMLCILPVLFIVLLGPAAMDIVKAFQ